MGLPRLHLTCTTDECSGPAADGPFCDACVAETLSRPYAAAVRTELERGLEEVALVRAGRRPPLDGLLCGDALASLRSGAVPAKCLAEWGVKKDGCLLVVDTLAKAGLVVARESARGVVSAFVPDGAEKPKAEKKEVEVSRKRKNLQWMPGLDNRWPERIASRTGWSDARISRELGMSPTYVSTWKSTRHTMQRKGQQRVLTLLQRVREGLPDDAEPPGDVAQRDLNPEKPKQPRAERPAPTPAVTVTATGSSVTQVVEHPSPGGPPHPREAARELVVSLRASAARTLRWLASSVAP